MSASWISDRFGTPRGALRLALSYGEVATGLSAQRKPDAAVVRRLVFVCHGNICRSAYADVLAARGGAKTASFGLSTHTGVPAHAPVIALVLGAFDPPLRPELAPTRHSLAGKRPKWWHVTIAPAPSGTPTSQKQDRP